MKVATRIWMVTASALAAASAAPAADAWWQLGWPYRRLVTVANPEPTRLPGEDVAVVTMPTGGKVRPDGSDIRVASAYGNEMPCRVLMVGPGDQVRVAFAIRPRVDKYYVYYGHGKPPATKPLDVRRGVLMETWHYSGGGTGTLEKVREIFGQDKQLIGRGFRDQIFLGHNPFGPQSRIASKFTGWLVVPKGGSYAFACTGRGTSYMLLDGELVYQSLGFGRGIDRRPTVQKTVAVDAGLHRLELYHVNDSGDPVVLAAWQLIEARGGKAFGLIPSSALAPVRRATPGAMEQYGRDVHIDFVPEHQGETFMVDRYFQRYRFRALSVGRLGTGVSWQWDFGDGQRSTAGDVQHVYLVPGEYTVTLKARTYFGELSRTNRVYVSRPWDRVTDRRLDPLGKHAGIVAEYDFARLGGEANGQAVLLLNQAGAKDALGKAGQAFVAREEAPGELVADAVGVYADALVAEGRIKEAVDALVKAATMTKLPNPCASLRVRAGQIALDGLGDADRAMELFTSLLAEYADLARAPAIQAARIGIGDVWRARGDRKQAAQAYAEAAPDAVSPAQALIMKGDFARHVEEYVRQRDFDAAGEHLDRWQRTFPADKLEGYWSLLRVQMLLAQSRYPLAAREAETLVRVNPTCHYAARLLMSAAEAYAKNGKAQQAQTALGRIVKDYPESPLAAEAARKLKAAE